MKKNIVVIIAIFISILLVFFGINILKFKNSNPHEEALKNAALTSEKKNERVEIKDPINSKYQSIVIMQDLKNPNNNGTGFIVGKNKILTNKHVSEILEEDKDRLVARLIDENGEFIDFKIKSVTHEPNGADLSIVEVATREDGKSINDNINTLELADQDEISKVQIGDKVHTVGYPGDKKYGTLWSSEGKILSMSKGFVIYDAFISGGNSGSPLLNKDGKIIGLSNASNGETEEKVLTYGFLLNEKIYNFVKSNI